MVLSGPFFLAHGARIIQSATRARVPVVWAYKPFARQGVLITYSAPITGIFRRSAEYVDKILKGTKPEDLPIERPTKFELVLNLKTAKRLGIKVSESILVRADEVIR
jgi:putative ABC transport system substrate-binding protein